MKSLLSPTYSERSRFPVWVLCKNWARLDSSGRAVDDPVPGKMELKAMSCCLPPSDCGALDHWHVLHCLVFRFWGHLHQVHLGYLQRAHLLGGLARHGLWHPLPVVWVGHLCMSSQGFQPGGFAETLQLTIRANVWPSPLPPKGARLLKQIMGEMSNLTRSIFHLYVSYFSFLLLSARVISPHVILSHGQGTHSFQSPPISSPVILGWCWTS